jgi:hypothetical protein
MLCAKCNNDNSADASFCEGCGAKLELVCPTCKTLRVWEPDSARNAAPRLLLLVPILIRSVHLNRQSESQPALGPHPKLFLPQ